MSKSVEDHHVDFLKLQWQENRDTAQLRKWIAATTNPVSDDLRALLVEVLKDHHRLQRRKEQRVMPERGAYLLAQMQMYRNLFMDPANFAKRMSTPEEKFSESDALAMAKQLMAECGYCKPDSAKFPETKGEITRAVKMATMHCFRLTEKQLRTILEKK